MSHFFRIIIILILSFFYFTSNSIAKNSNTRFIVTGHLYPVIKDEKKLKKFIEKINSYNVDYVFILGDSNLDDVKIFKKLNKLIDSKLYFSPGNHELETSKSNYLKNVGYLDRVIKLHDTRIILLNSSESLNNIKKNLKNFLKNKFENGPTIIMTHHRIWDDTIISQKPMQHDKSFYFEEIYLLIKDKVDFIFAGNSKRQYFRDLTDELWYGKQNINNIFWLDKIGSINAYSVGMGDGDPKANFTIVEVSNNDLLVKGDYSTIASYDILPKSLIAADEVRLSDKYSKKKYFFINKKKFFIFLILISILIVVYYKLKKVKNKNR